MYTKWTQHLTSDPDKVNFQNQVLSAKPVLDRVRNIILDYTVGLDRSETNVNTFDTPNWAYLQAYKNGFRACLNEINTLVDLDQQSRPKETTTK